MAVGKKKSFKKGGTEKSVASSKQVIIVLISLVVLIAVVAVLYPMLKEKGVTGKATAVPDEKKYSFCGTHDPGYAGLMKELIPSGNGQFSYGLCINKENSLGISCSKNNEGYIKDVADKFDALCFPSFSDTLPWVECNADGVKESNGDNIYSFPEGRMSGGAFLCAQNGLYESWELCTKDQTKGTIAGSNSQYLCYSSSTETIWKFCDKTLDSQCFSDGSGDFKFCCQEGKWNGCSATENNGILSESKLLYCDGTKWTLCDSSSVDISSNEKYYCAGNNFWQECKIENSFSSDYKALCKNGKWQALPEAALPPPGYDWAENGAPVPQVKVGEGKTLSYNVRFGTTVQIVGDPKKLYYCLSAQYCPGSSYKLDGADYCYAENTILPSGGQPATLCTLENNAGVWAVCSSTLPEEYKFYKNKYLCVAKKQQSAYWDKCDQDKVSGDNDEYHCDPSTSTWTKCTGNLEGDATANENFVCSAGEWTTMFKVGVEKNNLFEVRVQENGKAKNLETGKSTLGGITLCDEGTENIKSKATVCYTDKNKTVPKVVVPVLSLHSLQGSNQPQTNVDTVNDLLYVYDEADQKSVSLVKIIHPQAGSVQISETVLANNFKAGRRLAVEVDGHYYLLGQVPAGSLEMGKLQLISLPSLSAAPVTVLASDQYQFEIQAKKVLALKYVGTTITFSVGKVTQALAGAVQDHNLVGEYEVQFSKEQPVRLQDLDNKVLVPCLSDAPNDPLLMQLCLDDETQQPFISLERDVLVKTQLESVDVALLYHWDEATNHKLASVFYLQAVSGASESPTNFDYNDFNSNLAIAGNRVAVEFEGQLYLIKHEGNILSLPKVSLLSYTGTETAYPAASQSEKQVEFVVDGGKVYLTRSFSSPPPPFGMYGKTTMELLTESVDLVNELSTSMSSQVPVNIVGPINYGVIGRDTTSKAGDVLQYQPSFKIKGTVQNKQLVLGYRVPFVQTDALGNTLFYYYSAAKKDGSLVKSTQIYTLYNLSDIKIHPSKEHVFDDMFIDIFTNQGKQIALAFNSSFYLLGYAGTTPEEKSFFQFENLTLTSLDGSTKFNPIVSDSKADFTVPEGKVMVSVDPAVTTITFSKQDLAGLKKEAEAKATQEAKEAATVEFDPVKDYKLMLNSGQIVDINGVKYEICDKDVFIKTITDKVNLCKDGKLFMLLKGKNSLLKENEFVQDGNLLLQYTKSIVDGKVKKTITFWQAFSLGLNPAFSWLQLTANFENKQFPALLWNKEWYELSGASPALEDLEMDSLNGTGTCSVHVYPGEQGEQSGKISCQSSQLLLPNLLDIKQELVGDDIQFTITPTDDKLVTTTPFNVTSQTYFVSSLDKPNRYYLHVQKKGDALVELALQDSEQGNYFLIVYLPKGATREIILSNGDIITLDVLEISDKKTFSPIVAVSK